MDPEYLSILMCPKTKGSLRLASDEELSQVNLRQKAEADGGDTLQAGLVCESGGLLYPIRDGIPVLLADEAIELTPAPDEPNPTESSE